MNDETDYMKKDKKPWPTKDAMEQVYEMKLWGGDQLDFYSGEGSHKDEIIIPYIESVIAFLSSFPSKMTVCDLGCGDFNIGKELVPHTERYIAIDIVEKLIKRNKKQFKLDHLEFHCLNIVSDQLPPGDCIILRQVLQHLSNVEVQQILHKIGSFKYIILTEHIPLGDFTPNKDIISGQGIRLKKKSGLDITAAPFNFKYKEKIEMTSIDLGSKKGKITTTLYKV